MHSLQHKVKHLSLVTLFGALSGCAFLPQSDGQGGGLLSTFDEVANSLSCNLEKNAVKQFSVNALAKYESEIAETCQKKYQEPNAAAMRLLRAQLIAVVITRYGIAKIDDYAEDKTAYSARLAATLNTLLPKLKQAKNQLEKANGIVNADYPVIKADLYLDYIDLGIAASKPVTGEVRGLLFASRMQKLATGKTMLIGILKNALYKEAYSAELANIRAEMQDADFKVSSQTYTQAWTKINEQLIEQCDSLQKLNSALAKIECKIE